MPPPVIPCTSQNAVPATQTHTPNISKWYACRAKELCKGRSGTSIAWKSWPAPAFDAKPPFFIILLVRGTTRASPRQKFQEGQNRLLEHSTADHDQIQDFKTENAWNVHYSPVCSWSEHVIWISNLRFAYVTFHAPEMFCVWKYPTCCAAATSQRCISCESTSKNGRVATHRVCDEKSQAKVTKYCHQISLTLLFRLPFPFLVFLFPFFPFFFPFVFPFLSFPLPFLFLSFSLSFPVPFLFLSFSFAFPFPFLLISSFSFPFPSCVFSLCLLSLCLLSSRVFCGWFFFISFNYILSFIFCSLVDSSLFLFP